MFLFGGKVGERWRGREQIYKAEVWLNMQGRKANFDPRRSSPTALPYHAGGPYKKRYKLDSHHCKEVRVSMKIGSWVCTSRIQPGELFIKGA
jgi:hypothetical protein